MLTAKSFCINTQDPLGLSDESTQYKQRHLYRSTLWQHRITVYMAVFGLWIVRELITIVCNSTFLYEGDNVKTSTSLKTQPLQILLVCAYMMGNEPFMSQWKILWTSVWVNMNHGLLIIYTKIAQDILIYFDKNIKRPQWTNHRWCLAYFPIVINNWKFYSPFWVASGNT